LGPGEAITTPPASTLSFRNSGREDAEVLFICVPAYPPSNSDTEVLSGGHRPLTVHELRRSAERLRGGPGWSSSPREGRVGPRRAHEYLSAEIEARVSTMRWLAHTDESDEHRI